jgi:hypothetical protein
MAKSESRSRLERAAMAIDYEALRAQAASLLDSERDAVAAECQLGRVLLCARQRTRAIRPLRRTANG